MPDAEREQAESIAGRLWLRTPERPPRPAVARVLDEAVRRQRVVVLRYRDRTGAPTARAVEPVALAATRGHWHLLAWCRLRRGPRWFRTDRITAAHLTAEDAPDHDASTLFGTPPPDARPVTPALTSAEKGNGISSIVAIRPRSDDNSGNGTKSKDDPTRSVLQGGIAVGRILSRRPHSVGEWVRIPRPRRGRATGGATAGHHGRVLTGELQRRPALLDGLGHGAARSDARCGALPAARAHAGPRAPAGREGRVPQRGAATGARPDEGEQLHADGRRARRGRPDVHVPREHGAHGQHGAASGVEPGVRTHADRLAHGGHGPQQARAQAPAAAALPTYTDYSATNKAPNGLATPIRYGTTGQGTGCTVTTTANPQTAVNGAAAGVVILCRRRELPHDDAHREQGRDGAGQRGRHAQEHRDHRLERGRRRLQRRRRHARQPQLRHQVQRHRSPDHQQPGARPGDHPTGSAASRARAAGTNVLISGNTITGVHNFSIYLWGGDRITVEKNNVFDLFQSKDVDDVDVMRAWGTNHIVRNNYFHDINAKKSAGSPHSDCFQAYQAGSGARSSSNILIENNYCVRVTGQCVIVQNDLRNADELKAYVIRGNVCETYGWQSIEITRVPDVTMDNNYVAGVQTTVLNFANGGGGNQKSINYKVRNNVSRAGDRRNALLRQQPIAVQHRQHGQPDARRPDDQDVVRRLHQPGHPVLPARQGHRLQPVLSRQRGPGDPGSAQRGFPAEQHRAGH